MNARHSSLGLMLGLLCLSAGSGAAVLPDLTITDNPPVLRNWAPAIYPAELMKEKVRGIVRVRMVVDPQGKVTTARVLESPDPRLDQAALAAIQAWVFTPGLEEGKPAAACLDVSVDFNPETARKKTKAGLLPPLAFYPQPAPRTEAEPSRTPEGEYPEILATRKIAGAVTFACVVNADGKAMAPRITGASQVEFVLPALEALKLWEFTPAKQGDLPVKATLEAKISFDSIGDSPAQVLEVNELTAPDGGAPSATPGLNQVADPVWPYDLLLKGEGGSAAVEFTVRANGYTEDVRVREATRPEYGRALAAAMETWIFDPAISGGRAVEVPLIKHATFKPIPVGKESANDPVERVVAALRANAIGPATKLDEKLTPIYRVAPVYPATLRAPDRTAGRTEIEFVIDRQGRARVPRILSATREEFGWAAATAVAQWVFQIPRRAGQPVDVTVKIPFDFAAPAK